MLINEMIDQDCRDIQQLTLVISNVTRGKIPELTPDILPLLYELRDIYNLYCYIKDEVIYNRIVLDTETFDKHSKLTETHVRIVIILSACILSLEKNKALKTDQQFSAFLNSLTFYLTEEKDFLDDQLAKFNSKGIMKWLAVNYETSKHHYPASLLNNIYI